MGQEWNKKVFSVHTLSILHGVLVDAGCSGNKLCALAPKFEFPTCPKFPSTKQHVLSANQFGPKSCPKVVV